MISEVVIPDLGATGGDVLLEEWLVKPGDLVKAGSPLFVVTTDKATVEVEAFRGGYVRALRVAPGSRVGMGTVVAVIADSMEEPLEGAPAPESAEETLLEAPPAVPTRTDGHQEGGVPPGFGRILASPLARRIAKEGGINLATVKGTGSQGQILKRDVMRTIEASGQPPEHVGERVRRVPLSPMRRAIAERTQRSNAEAPHFYAAMTIDMTGARAFLKQAALEAEKNGWQAPTITDLVVRAAALALRQTPQVNASFQGDEILYYQDIHIGLVVGLPEGMLVPVIRHADRKNLYTLAAITRRLRQKATAGQLSSSELAGGTFTVSNLGMYGLDEFVAVINPPQAGILALGAARERPAVWEGQIVPRLLMTATLSVDHRAVDGVTAARFMDELTQLLENPVRLALEAPEEPTG